jgi:hypothetical protein
MNRSRRARLVLALGLAALAASWPSPSAAESVRGQLTYTCDAAASGYEDQAEPYPFGVALQMDVPERVRPGDVLSLSGTLSVQFPEELRSLAADYFTYAQAVSDSVTIPVTIGGRTTVLKASHFDSGKVATKNQPLILSSVVSLAPFTVPAGADGDIVVELPANGTVPSNIDDSTVAFTALALLSGGVVATFYSEYTYKAACRAPDGAQRTVAKIPVARPDAPSSEQGGSGGPAAPSGPADPATPAQQRSDSGASTGDPAAAPATDTPLAAAAMGPGEGPAAGVAGDPTTAPVAVEDGIRVPEWAVLLAATGVVLAAVLLAGWSHHRVRVLRATLEG